MNTISILDVDVSTRPKYRAVANAIRSAVGDGRLGSGDKLPPVRDLAWHLKITPGTVARAYSLLTDEGVLNAAVGRGTFVAGPEPERSVGRDSRWLLHNETEESHVVSLFSPKLPDVGQVRAIREAMVRVARREDTDLLNYPTRKAFRPAREAVVHWLGDIPLGAFGQEDLVLCHGGQNGISLAMQAVLRGRRPVVLVEELSYPGFRRSAELLRADVVAVPMDDEGILPDALEEIARRTDAQLLCTSPEVQNPTCVATPLTRRRAIARVVERLGMDILEDDCYRMGQPKLPSYRALLPRQAWYVSSISKTLTPALRVGFAVAPQDRAIELRRAAEYGFFGLARPLADLVEVLLPDPVIKIMADGVRERLREYVRAAVNALGGYALRWHEDVPFFWLSLPEGWRASAFCQAAEAQGVQIRPAEEFALRDARSPHAVRIAVNAHVPLDRFRDAMLRLRRLLDNPPEHIGV